MVPGRLDTSGDAALIFDAGRRGSLVIPWSAILALYYDPFYAWRVAQSPSPAMQHGPWSADPWPYPVHFRDHYYLTILLQDPLGKRGLVVFELGKEIVQPTLEVLQRRTGRDVSVFSLGACVAYKGREACGWGSPSELKGRTTVFIDTTGSHDSTAGESHQRLVAVIEQARLGVTVVNGARDAEIILAFRHEHGCLWCQPGSFPSSAVGEVYITHGGRLRVLLVFDEEARLWKRKLAVTFGQDFVRAYRDANLVR